MRRARQSGVGWERIGEILDVSPHVVARRYGAGWRRFWLRLRD
ncbi:MAG TPA: hypothetical protein VGF22_24295 [Acidimicrobiales bacterium]